MNLEEFVELVELVKVHAPSLTQVIMSTAKEENVNVKGECKITCKQTWCEFLGAISSSSPVCALIPPKKDVLGLLREMQESDSFLSSPEKLLLLQTETPSLFRLIENLTPYPIKVMQPVLEDLIAHSLSPFSEIKNADKKEPIDPDLQIKKLCYFPQLSPIRKRKTYAADRSQSSTCTKKSSGHPTLLPGIFTLFCPHGK